MCEGGREDVPVDAPPACSSAAMAAFRPKEHHIESHQAAPSPSTIVCEKKPVPERLAPGVNLQSVKMGMRRVAYAKHYNPAERRLMPHVSLKERFKKLNIEVELASPRSRSKRKCSAASTCDRADGVRDPKLCIECDACMTSAGRLPDDHGQCRRMRSWRTRLKAPGGDVTPVFVRIRAAETHRAGDVKDEDCVCTAVCARSAVPPPLGIMQKSFVHVATSCQG